MQIWTTLGMRGCPILQDRRGGQMVCTHDIFMFFYSYIEFLACWYLLDIPGMIISLCTCANIRPHPPSCY